MRMIPIDEPYNYRNTSFFPWLRMKYVKYGVLTIALFLILINIGVYCFRGVTNLFSDANTQANELYLLSEAEPYIYDVVAFERKVRQVSQQLDVPPEWLMAVMHSESRFDASVSNHKGSGATGLIQWMPKTAKDFDITVKKLRNLNHTQQLDFVYAYLDAKRKEHDVNYESLTDLYIAILYPRALGEDYCYTMYAAPSKAYQMNNGLDLNKDKRVTVQDIDQYLKRKYKYAYMCEKKNALYRLFTFITR